jgi:hypothetical protein
VTQIVFGWHDCLGKTLLGPLRTASCLINFPNILTLHNGRYSATVRHIEVTPPHSLRVGNYKQPQPLFALIVPREGLPDSGWVLTTMPPNHKPTEGPEREPSLEGRLNGASTEIRK